MKRLTITTLLTLTVVFLLSSCKKDELSIKNNELDLHSSKSGITVLNIQNNELQVQGKLKPEDAPNNTIDIQVTSNADPVGFTFTVTLTSGSYTEGKNKYLYKSFSGIVSAANYTDSERKRIKVSPSGDDIKVTVGNNLVSASFPIQCNEVVSMTYWPSGNESTLFIRGYEFDGSENKTILVWSSRDNSQISYSGTWDDPSQYQGPQNFSNFFFNINYVDGPSSSYPHAIGVNATGETTIYILYNQQAYSTKYKENTHMPLQAL